MIRKLPSAQTIAFIASLLFAARTTAAQDTAPAQINTASSIRVSDRELALHVLNRLAFGPRPGDVDRVLSIGVNRWIEQQLNADTALDQRALDALQGCNVWREPLEIAESRLSGMESFPATGPAMVAGRVIRIGVAGFQPIVTRDSAARSQVIGGMLVANAQLAACRLARTEFSNNQLLEVMTDFWHNHFSFYGQKTPTRGSIVTFDRGVIRPNALGRFRNLLGAVAHSPTMLEYLDNAISTKAGLNENYARELLELHTLGADGGYTQTDVIEVARAFTGWSHSRVRREGVVSAFDANTPVFVFNEASHDQLPKIVLGNSLGADRGVKDGEDVLDIVARHPSTAKFIARKLAVRLVSDIPPQSVIDRAAQVFTRTDGDIREVVRSIVMSEEFRSRDAIGAKVKSPLEFVMSLRRVFAAPVDTAAEGVDFLVMLDQPPYGRQSPDGWPETGESWLNVGAMMTRTQIVTLVANSQMPSIKMEDWSEWKKLAVADFDDQVEGVIRSLLNGEVSENTRKIMNSLRPPGRPVDSYWILQEMRLRDLIVLALGSPEFQRK